MDGQPEFSDPYMDVPQIISGIGELAAIGRSAAHAGLVAGFSGNFSQRLNGDAILVTAAGSIKANLGQKDFVVCNMAGGKLAGAGRPSSEMPLHRAIYGAFPDCAAIVHTHPGRMQALELAIGGRVESLARDFLNIGLYEAEIWRKRLVFAETGEPGGEAAAKAAVAALGAILPGPLPCAVWLPRHGLCAVAENAADALAISEELEHMAGVQLIAG